MITYKQSTEQRTPRLRTTSEALVTEVTPERKIVQNGLMAFCCRRNTVLGCFDTWRRATQLQQTYCASARAIAIQLKILSERESSIRMHVLQSTRRTTLDGTNEQPYDKLLRSNLSLLTLVGP